MQEEKFGKIIKEIRKKNNLTQKDLADKYHVTYQAVSKWENGKNMPDVTILKEISKDFNVSLDDLIDGLALMFAEPVPERYKEKYLEIRPGLVQAEELARHMVEVHLRIEKQFEIVDGPVSHDINRQRYR